MACAAFLDDFKTVNVSAWGGIDLRRSALQEAHFQGIKLIYLARHHFSY